MDPKRLPGEKDLCVTTMLDGVQVTLGDILTANVTGKRDRSTPLIVQHPLYYNSNSNSRNLNIYDSKLYQAVLQNKVHTPYPVAIVLYNVRFTIKVIVLNWVDCTEQCKIILAKFCRVTRLHLSNHLPEVRK